MASVDEKYHTVLKQLVKKIKGSRQRVASIANSELLAVYWEVGKILLEQREKEGWGKKIIEILAKDLKAEFPNMSGFSRRNLVYMQTFASAWPFYPFTQSPVAQLEMTGQTDTASITQEPIAQLQIDDNQMLEFGEPLLSRIPWTHHIIILDKAETKEERIFYIKKVIEHGWSSNMLKVHIDTDLYQREGKAVTNFAKRLPKDQAELAIASLKNPYILGFLDVEEDVHERDLERAILKHIQRFLLELGKGFAYVGNQFNVKVEGDEFALDLLFFNYNLNCFVVFELKVGDFKSEYAGKLNFYVNTIDAQIKMPEHNPTIGVLLCKTPNKTIVKYALQGIQTPLGVAEYELMPKQLKTEMPTIEELENELEKEIKVGWKPFEEKQSKLKEILARVKGEEIKSAKEVRHVIYIYEDVLLPLLNRFESILKSELELFARKEIDIRINETASPFFTLHDIQSRVQNNENIGILGLVANFNGFKPAGIKAFNITTELMIELKEYKYELIIGNVNINQERLYHYTWTREELDRIAEQWGEYVLDEINQRLETTI